MKLILSNGYPSPMPTHLTEVELDNIIDDAPGVILELDGVVHYEWKHTLTIEFESRAAFHQAVNLTGWDEYAPLILDAETDPDEGYEHPAIIADGIAYCGFIVRCDDPRH